MNEEKGRVPFTASVEVTARHLRESSAASTCRDDAYVLFNVMLDQIMWAAVKPLSLVPTDPANTAVTDYRAAKP